MSVLKTGSDGLEITGAHPRTTRVIVAITGRARSGKTTLATKLPGYRRWSFAAKLKDELAQALGLAPAELEGMKTSPSTRKLMQAWGAFKRSQDQNYYITTVIGAIKASEAHYHVVDDVRFVNELDALGRQGHLLTVRTVRLWGPTDLHPDESETALDDHPVDLTLEAETGEWGQFERMAHTILERCLNFSLDRPGAGA